MTSYAFLAPNALGVLVFVLFPVVASLALAFTYWQGNRVEADAVAWAGLDNFHRLLADPQFWQSLWNTLVLMLGVPLRLTGCLAVALVLNQRLKEIIVYRTLFFLPTISSAIAIFILWQAPVQPGRRVDQPPAEFGDDQRPELAR